MRKFLTKSFELNVNVKSAIPIYEQIKDAIKISIFAERLKEGDQIISIRELSTRHHINPITIMKAYNQLEVGGFLYSRRGSGYYVKAYEEEFNNGRNELFQREVSNFIKKIAVMGFKANDLLREIKKIIGGNNND